MRAVRALAIAPIRLYQRLFSPALGQRCRYYPTCSEYATQAIDRFGILLVRGRVANTLGLRLNALRRLLTFGYARPHPF